MPSTTFEEKTFRKASKFLEALRLSKPEWWDYHGLTDDVDRNWVRHWYFRGQRDSKWSLMPSAWRKYEDKSKDFIGIARTHAIRNRILLSLPIPIQEKWLSLGKSLPKDASDEEWRRNGEVVVQAYAEGLLINEFLQLAADLGHRVPYAREWISLTIKFIEKYIGGLYGDANDELWMHPVVALAQHHRISTRLLDWTRNPFCAAFFAAVEVANNPDPNKKIAVYAINNIILKYHIKLVSVPGSEIDFLRAQGGVFTYDSKGDELFVQRGQYPSLETSMGYIGAMFNPVFTPKKYMLPQTEAPELLRLLWLEGVTQAHLMPTLDNVSEALKTKWWLVDKTN